MEDDISQGEAVIKEMFNGNVGRGNRRYAVDDSYNIMGTFGHIPSYHVSVIEDSYDISFTKKSYGALMSLLAHYKITLNLPGYLSLYDHVHRERKMEETLREQNPALQKAWDNYQLLLNMVKK